MVKKTGFSDAELSIFSHIMCGYLNIVSQIFKNIVTVLYKRTDFSELLQKYFQR